MHADHRDFGPVVASLPLGADWPMRFRPYSVRPYTSRALTTDQPALLPRRLLLILADTARSAWMHRITRVLTAGQTGTRISAIFRTLAG